MTATWLGPEWKPERSKIVLSIDPTTRFLFAQVDPGHAAAWKREPYYGQIKRWAAASAREGRHVVVFVNKHATVVLADRDVPLGVFEPSDRLVSRTSPSGAVIEIEKVRAA